MGGAGELFYIDGYTHIGYIPSSFLLSGALFYEVTRVLRATRPAAFLLENVPNLQHVDGGRAMSTILAQLDAAGYIVIHRALNARPFVPQRRVRLYFVGFRKDDKVTTTPPCSMGAASMGAASRTEAGQMAVPVVVCLRPRRRRRRRLRWVGSLLLPLLVPAVVPP